MAEKRIDVGSTDTQRLLFGPRDTHLRLLKEAFGVDIISRGGEVIITGEGRGLIRASDALETMMNVLLKDHDIPLEQVQQIISTLASGKKWRDGASARINVLARDRVVVPRTLGQRKYLDAIQKNDVVFSHGPAGSGKSYLAVAMAVSALAEGEVRKIVLTRPAVEAGERLGFLPGDFKEKVNPYLQPLYDALNDMMNSGQLEKFQEKGIIEVSPLAYMRGRTLSHAFVILDEAQNTTPVQMKMFLTRLGIGSKAVITGDVTQTDLPSGQESGFLHACRILDNIKGLNITKLTNSDIVRHELVGRIVNAYANHEGD